jgi:phosphatidylserine/phosphatidylglycerophosphate/cardiolipin synthase-like enzyme
VEAEDVEEGGLSGVSVTLLVQPGSGLDPVIQALKGARKNIDIVIFRLSEREIERELEMAVARGVRVRALVAHSAAGDDERLRKVEQRLLGVGVVVARTADDFVKYHGKYFIVDGALHVLGFNFTQPNLEARSFGIRTTSRRAVQDAMRLFECDLSRQSVTFDRGSPLVVSPETSRKALGKFIAGARTSLAIYDGRLDDPDFVVLIHQRAAAGIKVRVIGSAPKLEDAVPVRELKGMKLHVRAMIRDGAQVFVGSQSLRKLELDRRRELGLILANRSAARALLEVFDTDWDRSSTPKLEELEEQLA